MNEWSRPTSLRWTMIRSVASVVLVFWVVAMMLLTWGTRRDVMADATEDLREAINGAKSYLEDNYELHKDHDDAVLRLRESLSAVAAGLYASEGGMALRYYDAQTKEVVAVSQLAYGSGYTDGYGVGERWYLEFDSGLDDEGQLEFAEKIMDKRRGGWYSYVIYPADMEHDAFNGDGTYARVTGVKESGNGIKVRRLTLVHPDGAEELLVETSAQGEETITVKLKHIELTSTLASLSWNRNGEKHNSHVDLERKLANYHAAQESLSKLWFTSSMGTITGERGGSGASSGDSSDGMALGYAWEYQALPIAMYNLRWTYVITLALVVLLILWMSRRLTVRTVRPLEQLCRQVEHGHPCEPNTALKEVNALADSFNEARQKLANELRSQRDLTRAVAHELKTPAAVLRAYAESLSEDAVPEKRQEYLTAIVEESDRMAMLVNELLDLSRMEGARGTLVKETVDLTALVQTGFERLRVPMRERGLELCLRLETAAINGDPNRLKQVVNNLAVNAMNYAAEGGVYVTLKREGERAVLSMRNNCPPIPNETLNWLWEPFYKLDESRSGEGSGLGLAVVKNIVELHGGTCRAEWRDGSICFTVELPC